MEVKLCYKTYPVKMSLNAMRQFKERTGKDLWFTIINCWHTYATSKKSDALGKLKDIYECCDFDTASEAIHALVKAENKNIPLDEIRDAMFRVGWLPTDRDGDMSEPWPLVMVKLAVEIDEQFSSMQKDKKKADI